MKTPRDLLLARHQAAIPKLDVLRREVIAGLAAGSAPAPGAVFRAPAENHVPVIRWRSPGWLNLLWRELVWPCHRTWTALAAIWVLLFLINVAQRDGSSAGPGKSPPPVGVLMTYHNQEKMLNELLADRFQPVEADRPKNITPKPRSEIGGRFAV